VQDKSLPVSRDISEPSGEAVAAPSSPTLELRAAEVEEGLPGSSPILLPLQTPGFSVLQLREKGD
jgi:hypothetical protein